MGQFTPKTYETILTRMINRVVARTNLNDINDGSSLKQVLAAASREDDDQYFQMINLLDLFDIMKARATDLDERAKEYNPNIIARNPAATATGQVQFGRTGTSGTITIPIGSQVQAPAVGSYEAIVFSTTKVATILAGNTTSGLTDVKAASPGSKGNVAAATVTGFVSKPSGVDTVTNPSAFTNGADTELDDSFRQRLLAYLKGLARAHVAGLEAAVLNLEDTSTGKRVKFANIVEDNVDRGNVILYIDDGAGSLAADYTSIPTEVLIASALGGEVDFYTVNKPIKTELPFTLKKYTGSWATLALGTDYSLNPASGHIKLVTPLAATNGLKVEPYTHYIGLIQLAQKVIDGDSLDRPNYPGYRAAGILVRVLSPQIIQLTCQANITVRRGYDQVVLAGQVRTAISAHINSLGISEDVILNELIERTMAVPGIFDIRFVDPSENRVILDDQIARILTANITIT